MAVVTAVPGRGSRVHRLRRRIQDNLLAYAFMAAGLACFAFFSWYPLVRGVILSFQQDNFVAPPYWVGLDNYRALFADPLFYTAWRNSLLFTGLALVFGFVLPFFIAVLLNEFRHFSGFFRVLVYLPVMLPPDRGGAALALLLRPGQRPVQHGAARRRAAGVTVDAVLEHRHDLAGPRVHLGQPRRRDADLPRRPPGHTR
nr:hypothetical protein GCM10020092_024610 [Actinoplanes digitatis]